MAIEVTELSEGELSKINPGPEPGYSIENLGDSYFRTLYEDTRIFKVTGLEGTISSVYAKKDLAISSITPRCQDVHPQNNRLWVTRISASLKGPDLAFVTVGYEPNLNYPWQLPQIRIGTSLISDTLFYKANGDRLYRSENGIQYYGEAPTMRVELIASIEVTGYLWVDGLYEAVTYSGTVNSGGPLGGGGRRRWLTTVNVAYSGAGNCYNVLYEFIYRKVGWDSTVIWKTLDGQELRELGDEDKDGIPEEQRTTRMQVFPEQVFPSRAWVI